MIDEKNKELFKLLEELSEREQKVIRLRYGLDNHQPKTLLEVGDELGITRERVRQIEFRALDKLRELSKKSQ